MLRPPRGPLRRLRGPGRRGRRREGAEGRSPRPARRRDRGHGARPPPGLPLPLQAAATAPRARRGSTDLRPVRALRRIADDGLDRRAADPDRPRRRLRHPVPGPLRRGGRRAACGRRCRDLCGARGGPAIGTACLATAAGFLALLLSPTPMVRSFGLLLVVGIAIAFGLALTAGFAALSLRGRRERRVPLRGLGFRVRSQPRAAKTGRRPLRGTVIPPPGRILDRVDHADAGVGLALAVVGWGVGTQIETQSDIRAAGTAEHRSGAGTQSVAGRDGRVRRARRQGHGSRPHRSRDPGMDGGIQAPGAARQRIRRRSPELPRRRSLPGPGAVGLRRRRRRAAATRAGACGAGRTAAVRPAPGRAGRPEDRPARPHRAAQLRHPRPVARRPAGPDRPGPGRDRRAREPGGPPPGVEVQLAGLPVVAAAAATDLPPAATG